MKSTALLKDCRLCPRCCRVNRLAGATGYCGAGAEARIFRFGAHFGEEPPISGSRGSGTIFFSHCTLRCIYCQNHPWSQGQAGTTYSRAALGELFRGLYLEGCHNWNLVSPTPWLPQIEEAVAPLLSAGISLPFVYNTSGFEELESLQRFQGLMDVALCDLRYAAPATAAEGSDALTYVAKARQTLLWLWEHLGPLRCDAAGNAQSGVICRLLVLPGRADEAIANLEWLAKHTGGEIHLSVMSQYQPMHRALRTAGWDRTLLAQEYAAVTTAMAELGFENGWIQDFAGAVPDDLLGERMLPGAGNAGAPVTEH